MSFATDVLFLYRIKPGMVAHRVMGCIRTFDKMGNRLTAIRKAFSTIIFRASHVKILWIAAR